MVKGGSPTKHRAHIRHGAGVPVGKGLVKGIGSSEQPTHIYHIAHIPAVNVLVHACRVTEHAAHARHAAQIRRIRSRDMHICRTIKRISHTRPSPRPPLLDFKQLLPVTGIVKVDTWEGTGNSNGVGTSSAIDTGIARGSCCDFVYTVIVTVNVIAVASASSGNCKASCVTSTRVVCIDDHNKGVGGVGVSFGDKERAN